MILKSFKNFLALLILILYCDLIKAEEKIDIWKNKNKQDPSIESKTDPSDPTNQKSIQTNKEVFNKQSIIIEGSELKKSDDLKVYGIHDPSDYNFDLNMWSSTSVEDIRASIKRIKKINLSTTSKEILENILLSFSYAPKGMKDKEFIEMKINWLIENNRINLLEDFLKQNEEFDGKRKAVQFLVDENISKADIKQGCEKIKFIDKKIKDSYLEKFKIYCLVFNNKNSEAQLLLDLLREQQKSDSFFDDKINYLLGISNKTSTKVNEKNLLNFYLSSVTNKEFKFKPNKKTKKEIWKYLNAANLITIEDVNDKKKISELEEAANLGQIDEKIIFDIYKQIPFNLNTLINAKNLYQSLDEIEARSLIYQKYLLSENTEAKLEYLFLLDDLFKKSQMNNIYSKFFSDNLSKIDSKDIPEEYQEVVEKNISKEKEKKLGKIKYNDKILHQSKIIKFYVEGLEKKKVQKDIDKIFKRLSKNRKYFYSAKDLALVDALVKDGFSIPKNFNFEELISEYDIPKNLLQLIEKKQKAFLALKIVEIIGEDEPHQLDPETIFFITSLLNQTDLIKLRNKFLISALPDRA